MFFLSLCTLSFTFSTSTGKSVTIGLERERSYLLNIVEKIQKETSKEGSGDEELLLLTCGLINLLMSQSGTLNLRSTSFHQ